MTQSRSFDEIESRLGTIVDAVSDEGTSLDEALALFEEAVSLGLAACEITENEVRIDIEDAAAADNESEGRAEACESMPSVSDHAAAEEAIAGEG